MSGIWGSSAYGGGRDGRNGVQEWVHVDNIIRSLNGNKGMQVRRSYQSGIPSAFEYSSAYADYGKRISAMTLDTDFAKMAAGDFDTALTNFCNDIPNDHTVYLGWRHEPEDDAGNLAYFKDGWARFAQVVLATGNTNIIPSLCLMAYTFQTYSGRNPDNYNPGPMLSSAERDACVMGVDGYAQAGPYSRTPNWLYDHPWDVFRNDWGFDRVGVFECGVNQEAVGRKDWMRALETHVASRNVEVVCWWHSQIFADSRWYYLFLDWPDQAEPDSIQTWADIIARNQDGSAPVVTVPPEELPDYDPSTPSSGGSSPIPIAPTGVTTYTAAGGLSGGAGLAGGFGDSLAFVHRNRVYWAAEGTGTDGLGNRFVSAAITHNLTDEGNADLWTDWDTGEFLDAPDFQGRGHIDKSDFINYGFYDTSGTEISTYENSWSAYGDQLWVLRDDGGGGDASIYLIDADTGDLLATRLDTTDATDWFGACIFGVADDTALIVRMNTLTTPDTAVWDRVTASGGTLTRTTSIATANLALTGTWAWPSFNAASGYGWILGDSIDGDTVGPGYAQKVLTWKYSGGSVTVLDFIDTTALINDAIGDDFWWRNDEYSYRNTVALSNGNFVDLAYTYGKPATTPVGAPGNLDRSGNPTKHAFVEFAITDAGVEVVQFKELPTTVYPTNYLLSPEHYEIGWGYELGLPAIGICENADGTVSSAFDYGYANGHPGFTTEDRYDYGICFVRDVFGVQEVNKISWLDGIPLDATNSDYYYAVDHWASHMQITPSFFVHFGHTLWWWTTGPAAIPDADPLFESPFGTYPGYDFTSTVYALAFGETPNLAGEFEAKKRRFARSPTGYTG